MAFRSFLLIDDDIDDHEIFQIALEMVSDEAMCHAFFDAELALKKIKDNDLHFDVIFVDLNMPKLDGVGFLKNVRMIDHAREIPVYIYSTTSSPEIRTVVLELGATDFVTKFSSIAPLSELLSGLM